MAYSDFTMSELSDRFGIQEKVERDLMGKPQIQIVHPSDLLKKN